MPTSAMRSPARSAVARASSPSAQSRSERSLRFAHFGWSFAILIDAAVFVFSVPALYMLLHRPCPSPTAACLPAQMSLVDFRALGGTDRDSTPTWSTRWSQW